MWKCNPLMPACEEAVAFLFLSEAGKENLIRWSQSERRWTSERVVPHVEAGHKDNLPLSCIAELLTVQIESDKASLAYRLSEKRNPDRREQAHRSYALRAPNRSTAALVCVHSWTSALLFHHLPVWVDSVGSSSGKPALQFQTSAKVR